jgi:lysophospholipase L1-like esterase
VVVDTLGIGGTRASNQLKWNEHVWSDNLRRRAPDLIVLAYGTNESVDDDQPIESYKKQLREVLARLQRAAPEASCLLVGPGDFPLKGADGGFAPRPRTGQIVEAQREISAEAGCAFWDAMQFMGGEGSMLTWTAAQPAMAQSDHLHLTRRGYARMGMALTDAIMFDYDAAAVPMPTADTQLANSGPADPSPSADGVAAAGPGDRSVVASPASQP